MKTKLKWILLTITLLQMMPILVLASGLTVEGTQMLFPHDRNVESKLKIKSFNHSRDGGFLLAGCTDPSHSLFLKINSLGKLVWKKSIDQKWPVCYGSYAFDSGDGGFWGIGHAYTRDIENEKGTKEKSAHPYELIDQVAYKYLLKMDSKGNPLKQSRLLSITPYPGVNCGIDDNDGLVFTGFDSITFNDPSSKVGKSHVIVSRIEKTDKTGTPVWHKIFSRDGNEVLDLTSNLHNRINYRALTISPSGKIIWTITVQPRSLDLKDGKDILPEFPSHSIPKFETVILELTQAGNEIRRRRSKDADQAFIFSLPDGYSLVEHFRPHVPDWVAGLPSIFAAGPISFFYSIDGGIRITRLDANLRVLKSNEYKIPAFNEKIGDVLRRKNGEYFLAGCNINGEHAIVHVNDNNNKFEVSQIFSDNRMNQCADFGWVENAVNNDLILFVGNTLDGYRLLNIKYEQ